MEGAAAGHVLDEDGDLIFDALFVVEGRDAGVAFDEVEVIDDFLDVLRDEVGGRRRNAFVVRHRLVEVVEQGNEVVEEAEGGDAAIEALVEVPKGFHVAHVDLAGVGVVDDAVDHRVDRFVDREDVLIDGKVLGVVDAEAVFGKLKDGAGIAIDFVVEVTDLLLQFGAVFARIVDDALKRGVFVDFD